MFIHYALALRVVPELSGPFKFSGRQVKQLFDFGGWLTVSSLMNTIVLFSDRMMVVSLFGVAAVTYYLTPYELVTKFWIISASILGALFPLLSAMSPVGAEMHKTWRATLLMLAFLAGPLVSLVIVFSRDFLGWWINTAMATQGGSIAKWIALGIYFSILSQLPGTILQATGNPRTVASIQLFILPIFLFMAWQLSRSYGSVGVAIAWCVRQICELGLLYMRAADWTAQEVNLKESSTFFALILTPVFLCASWLVETAYRDHTAARVLAFLPILLVYIGSSALVLRKSGIGMLISELSGLSEEVK
jgi:O-antigen/teichoic acid export membrane protein